MVYEKCLLADGVASVHEVLHGNVVDVVRAGQKEEYSGEVVGPQIFVDLGVEESVDAGDDEGDDEDDVEVDPDVVGEEVVVVPVDVLEHEYQMLQLSID